MPRDDGRGDAPSVIIIGAGVSGMAAGCYGQMSGLRTRILEKHVLPGGCCTAWSRNGYIFDYCIEWLNGTAAGNEANQVWRELGALDGKSITTYELFNRVVDVSGRSVDFYTDPDRLESHLLAISPVDAPLIRRFCADLRRFTKVDIHPFLTAPALRSTRERLTMLRQVLPMFRLFWRNGATQMHTFADRFQDPLLRKGFRNIFFQDPENFALIPYLYTMAGAHNGNVGFPQGGSLGLARSIEERYTSLGGVIDFRARVERVIVEDGRAVGVQMRGGRRHYADHVVAACDGYTTLHKLLGGAYTNPRVDKLYNEVRHRPGEMFPAVVSAFVGFGGDVDANESHSTTYLLSREDAARLPGSLQDSIVVQLRSRYTDDLAPPGRSLIHCTYFSDYDYWKSLRSTDRRGYWARKQDVAEFVREFLGRRYPGLGERIEMVSVATPTTTERYTGNHRGSIGGWKSPEADDLLAKLVAKDRMRLPDLSGFHMTGQWVAESGLIRAASSGRFVMQYVCQELGVPFQAWESDGDEPWHPGKLGHLPQLDTWPERQASTT
ncbi:phytoene desaturase family protein [Actinophytocola oryzae]|uniref:Phytoene dehydrogenase-like protein n=1 Tax=Actinophytocola oryzae TaxID=502181 RepID=A0A4R7VX43_9PSEU|nr:NAD(P)/FAD-dependent oxidoreductase [Actinophytocola oryzae]TDV54218.1 phytoene dehydrogenase-like protein [Actinophytocola oryzae]